MANVLCVYENKIATVLATENFLKALNNYDSRINVKFLTVLEVTKKDLTECDILYMLRPNNAYFGRLAKTAHNLGCLVIFFLDDDLMNLPTGNPNIPWRKKGLAYSAKQSDIIISSSPYICKKYSINYCIQRSFQLNTPVLENEIKQHIDGKNEKLKIVYAAGLSHTVFFDCFIKPVIKRLDDLCGERISLTFMGVHPDLDINELKMPISFIEPMLLNEYRTRIEKENFDIGLAPLTTTDFTKCKYFNKFIEYAMFGIVGLYSNTEPYTFVVNDKKNGFLIGDSPDDWLNSICNLVNNPELLNKCRIEAYETLRRTFNEKIIFENLIKEIPEFTKEHNEQQKKPNSLFIYKMMYKMSRVGDWGYKFVFYFRKGGIKEVFLGIKRRRKTIKLEKSL